MWCLQILSASLSDDYPEGRVLSQCPLSPTNLFPTGGHVTKPHLLTNRPANHQFKLHDHQDHTNRNNFVESALPSALLSLELQNSILYLSPSLLSQEYQNDQVSSIILQLMRVHLLFQLPFVMNRFLGFNVIRFKICSKRFILITDNYPAASGSSPSGFFFLNNLRLNS